MESDDIFHRKFEALKEAVLSKKPVLKEIIQRKGTKNLYEYAKDYFDVNYNPPIRERQAEFIGTFRSEVEKRLGPDVAASAAQQLEQYYFISTADHQGPICHPFFVNSNLLMAAPYEEFEKTALKNVIVLSCANVSLNNSSFPRGLLFNAWNGESAQLQRLSFLPSNAHSSAVYNFRPYKGLEIKKLKKLLREKGRDGGITPAITDKIYSILDEVYGMREALAAESYSDQITITNFHFWKKFFTTNGYRLPNLIYLEQEGLVTRLLMDHHLDSDSTVKNILFNPAYIPLIDKYFEGIAGAFSKEKGWGTYFFWGVSPEKNYRVQLWRKNEFLSSDGGDFHIPMTPEAIRTALLERRIVPSMLLIFLVLCLYYGLKCLGGFSQVNYLTAMKNAYIKMQTDRENYRSIEVCARAQTKELIGDVSIAFLRTPKGQLIPATGLDLILYEQQGGWSHFLESARTISLEEALDPMMPEFYRIIYPDDQRDNDLMSVSTDDIIHTTHLDRKMQACASIT